MSILTNMIKELRDRKLWPIAIGLIVALVAVPVLLTKKAPTNLVVPQPTGGLPYSTGNALPAISVVTKPGSSKLAGRGRDPFTPQHVATTASVTKVTTSASTTGAPVVTGSAGSAGATAPSAGSGSATSTPTASAPAPATTPTTPSTPVTPKPAAGPAPSGLTAKQSYQVSLAITTSGGGLNTINPLQRLSLLPSPQQPLLVELGVLQGGKRVLFAVQLGAAVSGPGTCIPGPIDCEVIALAPGQTEGLSKQTPNGPSGVAQFSVNSITAVDHPDVASANAARAAASDAGRKLLANSPLSGNGLFEYDPNVGAVVDLRNLTVGG